MRPDQGQELQEVISTCFCSFLYILYYSLRCRLRFIWHPRMPGSLRPVEACLACAALLGRTSGPLNGIAGGRPGTRKACLYGSTRATLRYIYGQQFFDERVDHLYCLIYGSLYRLTQAHLHLLVTFSCACCCWLAAY